jgi:hypothetical protein
VRVAAALAVEPDEREHLRTRRARPLARQAEADVVGDGPVREEGVVLEHHPDVPPLGRHPRPARHDASLDADRARVGRLEARHQTQERRLAAPARSEDGHDLPGCDRHVDVLDGRHSAEALRHPVQADHLHD